MRQVRERFAERVKRGRARFALNFALKCGEIAELTAEGFSASNYQQPQRPITRSKILAQARADRRNGCPRGFLHRWAHRMARLQHSCGSNSSTLCAPPTFCCELAVVIFVGDSELLVAVDRMQIANANANGHGADCRPSTDQCPEVRKFQSRLGLPASSETAWVSRAGPLDPIFSLRFSGAATYVRVADAKNSTWARVACSRDRGGADTAYKRLV